MLRSIGKQSGESVESDLRKKRKATLEMVCRKKVLSQVPDSVAERRLVHISQDDAQSHR